MHSVSLPLQQSRRVRIHADEFRAKEIAPSRRLPTSNERGRRPRIATNKRSRDSIRTLARATAILVL